MLPEPRACTRRPRGRVVAVVRASDDAAARARLRSGYQADAELLATFDRLAEGRLQVVAGVLLELMCFAAAWCAV